MKNCIRWIARPWKLPEPCESANFKNISIVKSNILILVVVQTAFLKTVNKTAKKFWRSKKQAKQNTEAKENVMVLVEQHCRNELCNDETLFWDYCWKKAKCNPSSRQKKFLTHREYFVMYVDSCLAVCKLGINESKPVWRETWIF